MGSLPEHSELEISTGIVNFSENFPFIKPFIDSRNGSINLVVVTKYLYPTDLISIIVSGPSTGSLINLMQNFPDPGSGKCKVAPRDDATPL